MATPIVDRFEFYHVKDHHGPWDTHAIELYCRKATNYHKGLVAGWTTDDSWASKYVGRLVVAVCPHYKISSEPPKPICEVFRVDTLRVQGVHQGRVQQKKVIVALIKCYDGKNYLVPGWAMGTAYTNAWANIRGNDEIQTMNVYITEAEYTTDAYMLKPRIRPDSTEPKALSDNWRNLGSCLQQPGPIKYEETRNISVGLDFSFYNASRYRLHTKEWQYHEQDMILNVPLIQPTPWISQRLRETPFYIDEGGFIQQLVWKVLKTLLDIFAPLLKHVGDLTLDAVTIGIEIVGVVNVLIGIITYAYTDNVYISVILSIVLQKILYIL